MFGSVDSLVPLPPLSWPHAEEERRGMGATAEELVAVDDVVEDIEAVGAQQTL